MEQSVYDLSGDTVLELRLPAPNRPVLGKVRWGHPGALFSPAFWKAQAWYAKNRDKNAYLDYATGTSLSHEVAACLLGGHGITSEMAQAAFAALHEKRLLEPGVRDRRAKIETVLRIPRPLFPGERPVRYRFPAKKAEYLASALHRVSTERPPEAALDFRAWLRSFRGVGWKTASWITRNWKHSDDVAVIDIHVFRAGVIAGLFDGSESTIAARYPALEARFLEFARAINEEARRLDVLIWRTMKDSQHLGLRIFGAAALQSAA